MMECASKVVLDLIREVFVLAKLPVVIHKHDALEIPYNAASVRMSHLMDCRVEQPHLEDKVMPVVRLPLHRATDTRNCQTETDERIVRLQLVRLKQVI